MFHIPNLETLAIGLILASSFLAGALINKLAKEEISKGKKYITWAQLIVLTAACLTFIIISKIYGYAILLASLFLIAYFIPKKLKDMETCEAFLLAAALIFALNTQIKEIVIYTFFAYGILLASKSNFKAAGKHALNFLTTYIVLAFFVFDKIASIHAFLVIISLIPPLIIYKMRAESFL